MLLAVKSNLFPTDNILKMQKGQSVKEGTKEKGVGEEHLSVSDPEKDVNCLQGFQYNHTF